jgi:glycyl-tRNA synthetase
MQNKLEDSGSADLSVEGQTYTLQKDMVSIKQVTKTQSGYNYTPSVIEPSFGIGRILYCVFEHCFYTRPDDSQKTVFRFSPSIAPIKTTVFPLLQRKELNDVAMSISLDLRRAGISSIIDTTGVLCPIMVLVMNMP